MFAERLRAWVGHPSPQYRGYDEIAALVDRFTYEQMVDERRLYVGTPDEVAAQFAWTRELFGEAEPSIQVNFGSLTEADGRRTLELMAAHVLPGSPMPPLPDTRRGNTTGAASQARVVPHRWGKTSSMNRRY